VAPPTRPRARSSRGCVCPEHSFARDSSRGRVHPLGPSLVPLRTVQGASGGTTHPATRAVVAWLILGSESLARPLTDSVQGTSNATGLPVACAVALYCPVHFQALSSAQYSCWQVSSKMFQPRARALDSAGALYVYGARPETLHQLAAWDVIKEFTGTRWTFPGAYIL
jgi:hypothetical protein